MLVRMSPESIPFEDPQVTRYAMDIGGAFGEWLSELMVDLRTVSDALSYIRQATAETMNKLGQNRSDMAHGVDGYYL